MPTLKESNDLIEGATFKEIRTMTTPRGSSGKAIFKEKIFMRKQYLMTPGPTPVPEEVMASMSGPIIHHRTAQFKDIIAEVEEGLRYVFQTKADVLIFTSSGTGAMEAAVANLLSPKQKVVVVRGGKFGERWAEICQVYGVDVIEIDVEWGKAVEPERVEEALKKQKQVKAVFTTLCETSTGVDHDIQAIGNIVKQTEGILIVDAISGLGACDLQTDNWDIDVVVAGSQKGLMIPPGLAFVSLSEDAWKMVEGAACPRYYFDFRSYRKSLENSDTPFTPAITLIIGLAHSLRMIRDESLRLVFERHKKLATATREAVKAMGLELFAPEASSNAVTAVKVPEGVDGAKLVKLMKEKYGVTIAGGQTHLKGKIFRIAHLGYISRSDVKAAISALEAVLLELGCRFEPGVGLAAAEEALTGLK